jgi:streptogramin lyase
MVPSTGQIRYLSLTVCTQPTVCRHFKGNNRAKSILIALIVGLSTACHGGGAMPITTNGRAAASLRSGAVESSRWRIRYANGVTYAGVVLGPDGNIWMCDGGFGTTLDRFTSRGVKKYELGYDPRQLTVGADRAFWITIANAPMILRVTSALKITAYAISDSPVGGIVLGKDHNVWFVEQHYIGRISPRGELKEYPLVVGSAHLLASGFSGIDWGPDGHLWFGADWSGPRMVNLDPVTGLIKIVGPGSDSIGPIVTGPDGNIWYIDSFLISSYRTILTKITTTGHVTTYDGPADFVQPGTPQGMVVGPDGALWFVTQHIGGSPPQVIGGGLVRYDIGKKRFSVSAPPHGYEWEWGLAFDRSNNVWMSANNQAQVFTPNSKVGVGSR